MWREGVPPLLALGVPDPQQEADPSGDETGGPGPVLSGQAAPDTCGALS